MTRVATLLHSEFCEAEWLRFRFLAARCAACKMRFRPFKPNLHCRASHEHVVAMNPQDRFWHFESTACNKCEQSICTLQLHHSRWGFISCIEETLHVVIVLLSIFGTPKAALYSYVFHWDESEGPSTM